MVFAVEPGLLSDTELPERLIPTLREAPKAEHFIGELALRPKELIPVPDDGSFTVEYVTFEANFQERPMFAEFKRIAVSQGNYLGENGKFDISFLMNFPDAIALGMRNSEGKVSIYFAFGAILQDPELRSQAFRCFPWPPSLWQMPFKQDPFSQFIIYDPPADFGTMVDACASATEILAPQLDSVESGWGVDCPQLDKVPEIWNIIARERFPGPLLVQGTAIVKSLDALPHLRRNHGPKDRTLLVLAELFDSDASLITVITAEGFRLGIATHRIWSPEKLYILARRAGLEPLEYDRKLRIHNFRKD